MKLYKIRNRATGLWSSGGMNPRWTKKGKTWATMAHVKSHLRNFEDNYGTYAYRRQSINDWDIVEFEIQELQGNIIPAIDFINHIKNEKKLLEQKYKDEEKQRKQERRNAIKKLSKKECEALGIYDTGDDAGEN